MADSLLTKLFDTERLLRVAGNGKLNDAVDRLLRIPGLPTSQPTAYRWLGGVSLPDTADKYLLLAEGLGLDPLALWRLDRVPPALKTPRAWVLGSRSHRVLNGLLAPFFVPSPAWPPRRAAADAEWRWGALTWAWKDLTNTGARAGLATIELRCSRARPQVFHFAWRPPHQDDWRPYGVVLVDGEDVFIVAILGSDATAHVPVAEPVRVGTWFGSDPAAFRVASMHPFDLEVVHPSTTPVHVAFR